jgi:hypothetical protein
MKYLMALLLASNLFTAALAHEPGHDHPSVHGMLMVGQSKIYLSHLPMFHSPHDYQVIVEAEVSAEGKAAYLSSLGSSAEKVYTLVPESFVLPDMIKNPKPFKAQIFKGHFEREGVLLADKVTVLIKKVIYFKKFNPSEVKPKDAHYLLFGNEKEQFLAHEITQRPDFDQVLKIDVVDSKLDGVLPVVFENVLNTKPLEGFKDYQAEKISVHTKESLYVETGDLE